MLERWGWFVVRRRKGILAFCLLGAVAAVYCYATLPARLSNVLFTQPGSEAYRAQQILEKDFGVGVPNFLLVVTARSGSVDDPAVADEAQSVVSRLAGEPGVVDVVSYWSAGRSPLLRSQGGNRALVVGRVLGNDKEVNDRLDVLVPRFERAGPAIDVRVGGFSDTLRDMLDISLGELSRAEKLTAPVTLVALLFVFGSVAAAFLPLLVAAAGALGTALVLWCAASFFDISVFSFQLTTAIGLGLSIDYSLFVVSRYREELAAGHEPDIAIVRTMRTAGRTVLFSTTAVMVALAALLSMPLNFLRSFGGGGMLTAGMSGVGALVILPAVLAVLGPNVNRWTVWRRSAEPASGTGLWFRLATAVMRRPLVVAGVVIVMLLVVGSPFLHFRPGLIDDRDLPAGSRSRITGEILRTEFRAEGAVPLTIVLHGTDGVARSAAIDGFARRVAALPHVATVVTVTGQYSAAGHQLLPEMQAAGFARAGSTYLSVVADAPPMSAASNRLVDTIRELPRPFPTLLVGGEGANHHDITQAVRRALPPAFAFVALVTGLILFLQFGSVLVPLKAILLNLLSLTVLLGGMVWVFQDGHLAGLFDITATGSLYVNMPVFIFFLAFGLSMDYEVFLLSRIKEEYDRTGDNDRAVALGLERSGRIVSAAAVLIAIVFFTVGLSGTMTASKEFGFGLAAVVLLDAFVIRGTLVPAFMKLAGSANWWAPRPLRWIHDRIGVSEHVDLDEGQVPRAPASV